jgi:hypothetical protein
MSIFNTILDKLGIHKNVATATPAKPNTAAQKITPPAASVSHLTPGQNYMAPPPAKPAQMQMVDVVSKLDGLAKASPVKLDWKVSINDLMALLGMDHSPDDIKALAVELGCPEAQMGDSYSRNVWTHKELLKRIAENGGNIPQNLLD